MFFKQDLIQSDYKILDLRFYVSWGISPSPQSFSREFGPFSSTSSASVVKLTSEDFPTILPKKSRFRAEFKLKPLPLISSICRDVRITEENYFQAFIPAMNALPSSVHSLMLRSKLFFCNMPYELEIIKQIPKSIKFLDLSENDTTRVIIEHVVAMFKNFHSSIKSIKLPLGLLENIKPKEMIELARALPYVTEIHFEEENQDFLNQEGRECIEQFQALVLSPKMIAECILLSNETNLITILACFMYPGVEAYQSAITAMSKDRRILETLPTSTEDLDRCTADLDTCAEVEPPAKRTKF